RLDTAAREAKDAADAKRKENKPDLHKFRVQRAKLDASFRDIKARLDSTESLYYIALDTKPATDNSVVRLKNRVAALREELEKARVDLEQTDAAVKSAEKEIADAEMAATRAEAQLKEARKKVDRLTTLAQQKQWAWHDFVRSQPIIDMFASPYRINQ